MNTAAATAGEIYENPVTGERALVLEGSRDDTGRLLVLLTVQPGGAVAGEHIHSYLRERFCVLDGRLAAKIDGVQRTGEPGDQFSVPAGVPHDWWNAGPGPARVLVEVTPPGRFEQAITTLYGLARAGATNAKGMPGPLQLALIAREFDADIRFSKPPRVIQRVLFGALAPIARRRGLRPTFPYGAVASIEQSTPEFEEARSKAAAIWPEPLGRSLG